MGKVTLVTFYSCFHQKFVIQSLSHLLINQISQTWYQMNGLTTRSKVIFV